MCFNEHTGARTNKTSFIKKLRKYNKPSKIFSKRKK